MPVYLRSPPQQVSVADPGCFSRIRLFSILDPESRIPNPNCLHPGSASKEFKYYNPKKWFLSSRKCDPGCSSRTRMLTFHPSRIPDPGFKKAPDPDPQHWFPFARSISPFFYTLLFLPVSLLKIGYLIFYLVSMIFLLTATPRRDLAWLIY